MTEQDSLIRTALEFPNNRAARLAFARWLDEEGNSDQAALIRLRRSLADMSEDDSRFSPFEKSERKLSLGFREEGVDQCGLPLTWEQSLAVFRRRLRETVVWCGRCGGTLRTPALMPPFAEVGEHSWEPHHRTASERHAVVNRLANARARLLAWNGRWHKEQSDLWSGGRLLAFYPDATHSIGVAQVKSEGYLDAGNIPAWDSWVFVGENPHAEQSAHGSFLLCWVPPAWVNRVGHAIQLNPEKCLQWAADVNTPLTKKLWEAGLLS